MFEHQNFNGSELFLEWFRVFDIEMKKIVDKQLKTDIMMCTHKNVMMCSSRLLFV